MVFLHVQKYYCGLVRIIQIFFKSVNPTFLDRDVEEFSLLLFYFQASHTRSARRRRRHYPPSSWGQRRRHCSTSSGKNYSATVTRMSFAFTILKNSPPISDVDTKESSPMAVDLIYCHGFALFNVASTFFIGANTKHSAPTWRRYCTEEDRMPLPSPVVIGIHWRSDRQPASRLVQS